MSYFNAWDDEGGSGVSGQSVDSGGDWGGKVGTDASSGATSISAQGAGTAGLGAIGIGLEAWGLSKEVGAQKAEFQSSANQAALEMQVNAQRRQQMVLGAQRQQTENLRNTQRAQAAGLASGVSKGAQFGSGVAGGQSQAAAQGGYNALGINQNLEIGQNIFNLDDQIDQQKINYAKAQSSAASAQGWMSLGSSIASSAGSAASLAMLL